MAELIGLCVGVLLLGMIHGLRDHFLTGVPWCWRTEWAWPWERNWWANSWAWRDSQHWWDRLAMVLCGWLPSRVRYGVERVVADVVEVVPTLVSDVVHVLGTLWAVTVAVLVADAAAYPGTWNWWDVPILFGVYGLGFSVVWVLKPLLLRWIPAPTKWMKMIKTVSSD